MAPCLGLVTDSFSEENFRCCQNEEVASGFAVKSDDVGPDSKGKVGRSRRF